jgi:16S rRNA (guanine527-N7)-methyltransferase
MIISNELILKELVAYGLRPTDTQCDQIRAYISLLLRWNRSLSLTTVAEELEIIKFHFGESLFALSAIKGLHGRLADVGTGAGFPGLALRIFAEEIDLILIESNAKKCAFLSEVQRALALSNVRVLRARFEDVAELNDQLDVVVSRALGSYDRLLKWSVKSLRPGGKIVLWLGEGDAREISSSSSAWDWQPPIPIPGSKRRFLLPGSPRPIQP